MKFATPHVISSCDYYSDSHSFRDFQSVDEELQQITAAATLPPSPVVPLGGQMVSLSFEPKLVDESELPFELTQQEVGYQRSGNVVQYCRQVSCSANSFDLQWMELAYDTPEAHLSKLEITGNHIVAAAGRLGIEKCHDYWPRAYLFAINGLDIGDYAKIQVDRKECPGCSRPTSLPFRCYGCSALSVYCLSCYTATHGVLFGRMTMHTPVPIVGDHQKDLWRLAGRDRSIFGLLSGWGPRTRGKAERVAFPFLSSCTVAALLYGNTTIAPVTTQTLPCMCERVLGVRSNHVFNYRLGVYENEAAAADNWPGWDLVRLVSAVRIQKHYRSLQGRRTIYVLKTSYERNRVVAESVSAVLLLALLGAKHHVHPIFQYAPSAVRKSAASVKNALQISASQVSTAGIDGLLKLIDNGLDVAKVGRSEWENKCLGDLRMFLDLKSDPEIMLGANSGDVASQETGILPGDACFDFERNATVFAQFARNQTDTTLNALLDSRFASLTGSGICSFMRWIPGICSRALGLVVSMAMQSLSGESASGKPLDPSLVLEHEVSLVATVLGNFNWATGLSARQIGAILESGKNTFPDISASDTVTSSLSPIRGGAKNTGSTRGLSVSRFYVSRFDQDVSRFDGQANSHVNPQASRVKFTVKSLTGILWRAISDLAQSSGAGTADSVSAQVGSDLVQFANPGSRLSKAGLVPRLDFSSKSQTPEPRSFAVGVKDLSGILSEFLKMRFQAVLAESEGATDPSKRIDGRPEVASPNLISQAPNTTLPHMSLPEDSNATKAIRSILSGTLASIERILDGNATTSQSQRIASSVVLVHLGLRTWLVKGLAVKKAAVIQKFWRSKAKKRVSIEASERKSFPGRDTHLAAGISTEGPRTSAALDAEKENKRLRDKRMEIKQSTAEIAADRDLGAALRQIESILTIAYTRAEIRGSSSTNPGSSSISQAVPGTSSSSLPELPWAPLVLRGYTEARASLPEDLRKMYVKRDNVSDVIGCYQIISRASHVEPSSKCTLVAGILSNCVKLGDPSFAKHLISEVATRGDIFSGLCADAVLGLLVAFELTYGAYVDIGRQAYMKAKASYLIESISNPLKMQRLIVRYSHFLQRCQCDRAEILAALAQLTDLG